MKKNILLAASILAVAAFSVACQSKSAETTAASQAEQSSEAGSAESSEASSKEASGELKKIKIGATPSPHAEILEEANKVLKDKGYELDIVVYNDNECSEPHILVECKKADISDLEFEQAIKQAYSYAYAMPNDVKYVWVTSSDKNQYFEVDKSKSSKTRDKGSNTSGPKKSKKGRKDSKKKVKKRKR